MDMLSKYVAGMKKGCPEGTAAKTGPLRSVNEAKAAKSRDSG